MDHRQPARAIRRSDRGRQVGLQHQQTLVDEFLDHLLRQARARGWNWLTTMPLDLEGAVVWSALISSTFASSEYSALRENSSPVEDQAGIGGDQRRTVKKLSAGGVDEGAQSEVLRQLLQRIAQLVDLAIARLPAWLRLLELRMRGITCRRSKGWRRRSRRVPRGLESEVERLVEKSASVASRASTPAPSRYWVGCPAGRVPPGCCAYPGRRRSLRVAGDRRLCRHRPSLVECHPSHRLLPVVMCARLLAGPHSAKTGASGA